MVIVVIDIDMWVYEGGSLFCCLKEHFCYVRGRVQSNETLIEILFQIVFITFFFFMAWITFISCSIEHSCLKRIPKFLHATILILQNNFVQEQHPHTNKGP